MIRRGISVARIGAFVVLTMVLFIAKPGLNSQNQQHVLSETSTPLSNKAVVLPEGKAIKPEQFTAKDGKRGWKVHIPENRPLPTPCIWEGLLFTGGGFGSYEFYCLDAKTGEKVWQFHTGDDGPTAAVAERGYVVFNTESCIIYVLKAKTGDVVWERWLGDPLMSQPAVGDGWVYMAYPGQDGNHYLACMKLETGEERWKAQIIGDLISAPIIHKGSVYITTLEGTVYRYNATSGELVWSEKKSATSSPWLYKGKIFVSLREEEASPDSGSKKQYEGMANLDVKDGRQLNEKLWIRQEAEYLSYETSSRYANEQKALDASVGFGAAPGAAKLGQAQGNIGLATVSGVWAYQGSRPAVFNGKNYNAMGNILRSVDAETGKVLWEKKYTGEDEEDIGGRVLTPPSVVNGKLFVGSVMGDMLCYDAGSGKLLWEHNVGEPVRFQPAVSGGRVYFATDYGNIYCIETGDTKDDGWNMWGGNAAHNGLVEGK
jgi:Ca-activated chloride channel family protein